MNILCKYKKNEVSFYDPYIKNISTRNQHFKNFKYFELNISKLKNFDIVLLVTDHDILNYKRIFQKSRLIVDCRGRYYKNKSKKIIKL